MGQGAIDYIGVKGGLKLNDVIEEFKYVYKGKTIKAGDFVNYINGVAVKADYGTSEDTQLGSTAYTGYVISAVKLDDSRVFIAHSYTTDYYLYGMIVTINGTSITTGTDIQLLTTTYTARAISTQLLPNGNVFIAHDSGYSNSYLYGMIASINGTTITAGLDNKLNANTSRTGQTISTQLLPNGNVFIAHSYGSDFYLYGMVCTVSGTTITAGTDTLISMNEYTGNKISTALLSNGNIFIAHSYSSRYYLYGMVATINGTTITTGTDTVLSNSEKYNGYIISATLLSNGNVFIVHSYTTSYYIYGMIATISGTAITAGTDTQLNYSAYHPTITSISLKNNKVFVMYNQGNTEDAYYLNGLIANISGTKITVGSDTILNSNILTGYMISPCLLANGAIFVGHSYGSNYHLYAQIWGIDETNNIPTNEVVITEYEQQVTLATEPPFDGIALSDGVGGTDTAHNQQVKIARPNNL